MDLPTFSNIGTLWHWIVLVAVVAILFGPGGPKNWMNH